MICGDFPENMTVEEAIVQWGGDVNRLVRCNSCRWIGSIAQTTINREVPCLNSPRLCCPKCGEDDVNHVKPGEEL